MNGLDLCGDKYGRLTVVKFSHNKETKSRSHRYWECICDCGNTKLVSQSNLRSGSVSSCGCLHKEIKTPHGKYKTKEYKTYYSMLRRCYSDVPSQAEDYLGRGITVCDRWLEPNGQGFINFYDDMGEIPPNLTLDRIDNDKGYSPENCRWADSMTQNLNKRSYKNNSSGYPGVYKTTLPKGKRQPTELHYWTAWWKTAEGRAMTKNYSIKKYGEKKAKELAIQKRAEGMAWVKEYLDSKE